MQKTTFDVAVIGAGVIGTSTALSLARLGYRVGVFDSKSGAGTGTTSYSSGICRMFYSIPDSVKFAWEGYHYWREWEDFVAIKTEAHARLRECGGILVVSENSQSFIDKTVPCMEQAGVPVEVWDLNTSQKRLKKLGVDLSKSFNPARIDDADFGVPNGKQIKGAVYCPATGYVSDPTLAVQNLMQAAGEQGAEFLFNSKVMSINQNQSRVSGITLENGQTVEAPVVLNAAGPHSSFINALAFPGTGDAVPNDMLVPTRAMRQEVAYAAPPPGVDMDKDGMVITDLDIGAYWRPEVGNKILIGGIEPECDPEEWVDDIDDMNMGLTENWTNYIYRVALRMPEMPLPTGMGTQGIVSAYDVTPDWTPIYDKSALCGYYMACGTSGNQFKNAGVAGVLMATLIDKCENGYDHDKEPLQFELTKSNSGKFLDTKCFSRLRDLSNTSGSVLG
eukprot:g4694.t1